MLRLRVQGQQAHGPLSVLRGRDERSAQRLTGDMADVGIGHYRPRTRRFWISSQGGCKT